MIYKMIVSTNQNNPSYSNSYDGQKIEEILIKKKNYVSVRSIESKNIVSPTSEDKKLTVSDINTYLKNFLDSSKMNQESKSYFTDEYRERVENETQTGIQYDRFINILKRYVKDYVIDDKTFLSDDCNYRIDLMFPSKIEMIENKFYRIFLTSCDNNELKIDNIIYIDDMNDITLLNRLTCDMIMNDDSIGIINIEKESIKYKIKITGKLNKLNDYKGKSLGLHIHTQGDISDDCKKCGVHYNPTLQFHGDVSGERHLGDIGNIIVDMNGESTFIIYITTFPFSNDLLLHKFIGRSIVLHSESDDLGKGKNLESSKTGNSGNRIACGILGGIYD
jgi:Cu-Zn family superoxide dismutase